MGMAFDDEGNVFNAGIYTLYISNPGQERLQEKYIYLGTGTYTSLTGGEPNFYYVKINVRAMFVKGSHRMAMSD